MKRRRFLGMAGAGAAGAGLAGRRSRSDGNPAASPEPDLLARLVRANDARIPALLDRQEMGASHPWLGAVRDEHGIHSAGGTAGLVPAFLAALASPGSRFHGSPEIGARLALAARALLSLQHADGTVDLHTTNFHSPPDTAFALEPVCVSLSVIRRTTDSAVHTGSRTKAVSGGEWKFVVARSIVPSACWRPRSARPASAIRCPSSGEPANRLSGAARAETSVATRPAVPPAEGMPCSSRTTPDGAASCRSSSAGIRPSVARTRRA